MPSFWLWYWGTFTCTLVPVLNLVPGNIRMYPRSGFWYRGTSAKTTLSETTLCEAPILEGSIELSRSETWVPKRGGLKPAGKRQESASFLQRSFFDVAVQFFVCCSAAFGPNDFRTAEKPMLQCSFCSAACRKLQRNFRFRLWHVAGAGFRGVGFRTCQRTFSGRSPISGHRFKNPSRLSPVGATVGKFCMGSVKGSE